MVMVVAHEDGIIRPPPERGIPSLPPAPCIQNNYDQQIDDCDKPGVSKSRRAEEATLLYIYLLCYHM